MKKILFLFPLIFISLQIYCQQWHSMGVLDTIGTTNGNKFVWSITNFNNKITIGGAFKHNETTILNSIAQWSSNLWQTMSTGFWASYFVDGDGGALALSEYHNKLYCGGTFEGAGGVIFNPSHYAYNIAKWDTTDWYPMTQPADGFNSGGSALYVYHNNLYAGNFADNATDSSGTIAAQGIVRWNDTVFSAVGQLAGDFPPNGYFGAMAFTNFNNKLIVGGYFTSINGSPYGTYNGIASWNDTVWGAMSNGFNDVVYALTVFNGELYAGGVFSSSRDGSTSLNHIAKWNGLTWVQVGEGLNDTVYALTVDSVHNKLYAGGGFTQTGLGIPAKHIAEWTGTNWQEVGGGTNRDVQALYAKDSNLYVGGYFTRAGNVQADLIACWCVNSPLSVEELQSKNTYINCYPNPATESINFSYVLPPNVQQGIINVYNAYGQIIQSFSINKAEGIEIFDLTNQSDGLYFYSLFANNANIDKGKFVISR